MLRSQPKFYFYISNGTDLPWPSQNDSQKSVGLLTVFRQKNDFVKNVGWPTLALTPSFQRLVIFNKLRLSTYPLRDDVS